MKKLEHASLVERGESRKHFSGLAIAGAVLLSACAEAPKLMPTQPVADRPAVVESRTRGPSTFDDPMTRLLRTDDGHELRVLYPPAPLERMIINSERYKAETIEQPNAITFFRRVSSYFLEDGKPVIRNLPVGMGIDKASRTLCNFGVGYTKELGNADSLDMKEFRFRCLEGPNGEKIYSAKIAVTMNPHSMTAFAVPYDNDGNVIGAFPNGDVLVFGMTFKVTEKEAIGGWAVLKYSPGSLDAEVYRRMKVSSVEKPERELLATP